MSFCLSIAVFSLLLARKAPFYAVNAIATAFRAGMILDSKMLSTPETCVGGIFRHGGIKEPGEFGDDTRIVHDCPFTAATPLVSQIFFQFVMIEISHIGAVESVTDD